MATNVKQQECRQGSSTVEVAYCMYYRKWWYTARRSHNSRSNGWLTTIGKETIQCINSSPLANKREEEHLETIINYNSNSCSIIIIIIIIYYYYRSTVLLNLNFVQWVLVLLVHSKEIINNDRTITEEEISYRSSSSNTNTHITLLFVKGKIVMVWVEGVIVLVLLFNQQQ